MVEGDKWFDLFLESYVVDLKKNDWIIILAGLLIALVVYGGLQLNNRGASDGAKRVDVYIDGQLVEYLPLSEDLVRRYETDQGYNVVEVSDGAARIIEADCLTKSCILDGDIDGVNETVVCLPHHFHIQIKGVGEVEIDAISE